MDPMGIVAALLVVLVLVIAAIAVARRRMNAAPGPAGPPMVSRETAIAASRLLSAEGHAEVYGYIGRGNQLEAIRAYRRHTRAGLKQCVAAVQSLEKYPQEYKGPDFGA
jgi:hypothetical protein